jgi:hypothetical protein
MPRVIGAIKSVRRNYTRADFHELKHHLHPGHSTRLSGEVKTQNLRSECVVAHSVFGKKLHRITCRVPPMLRFSDPEGTRPPAWIPDRKSPRSKLLEHPQSTPTPPANPSTPSRKNSANPLIPFAKNFPPFAAISTRSRIIKSKLRASFRSSAGKARGSTNYVEESTLKLNDKKILLPCPPGH